MKPFIILEVDRRNRQAGKIILVARQKSGVLVRALATVALIVVVALTFVFCFLT